MKRNEPEKSIFASLLERISDTLTKTVENIEKQKLEDIGGEDGDNVLQTTTIEKELEITLDTTTEAPETTSRYIGGGRRHEENDVLDISDEEVTNTTITGNESIKGKKSNGDEIEADTREDEEDIEDEEEVFVDYSNDGDWTPLSPHGRLVVRVKNL